MTAREAGDAALRAGDPAAAARHYEAAVHQAPADAAAWSGLGLALSQGGRLAEGLAALDRAAALAPGEAAYPYQRGWALEHAGRSHEAAGAYQRALHLDPQHYQAHEALIRLGWAPALPSARYVAPPYQVAAAVPGGAARDDGTRVALLVGGSAFGALILLGIGCWGFWAYVVSVAARTRTPAARTQYVPQAPRFQPPRIIVRPRPALRTPEIHVPAPPTVRMPPVRPPEIRMPEVRLPQPPTVRDIRFTQPREIVIPSPPRIRFEDPDDFRRRIRTPPRLPEPPDWPRPPFYRPRVPGAGGESPAPEGATPAEPGTGTPAGAPP